MKLGTNLSGLTYYNPELPITDVFQGMFGWNGEGWDYDVSEPLYDANGWPRDLNGSSYAAGLTLRSIVGHYPGGTYNAYYLGSNVTLAWAFDAVRVAGPTLVSGGKFDGYWKETLTVTPSNAGVSMAVTATDDSPNNFRDMHILPAGGVCSSDPYTRVSGSGDCSGDYVDFETYYDSTLRFMPEFLRDIKGYACLRYMDLNDTNNSEEVDWADRQPMAKWSWQSSNRLPYEVMIELANKTNITPWFTLPAEISDSYASSFGALIEANLNPGLSFRLELSNEVWNTQFSQEAYFESIGTGLGGLNAYWNGQRAYSKRAAEVHALVRAELSNQTRCIRVMSGQAASVAVMQEILSFDAGLGAAYLNVDEFAIAPYITLIIDTTTPPTDATIVSESTAVTFARLDTALATAFTWVDNHNSALASYTGVSLIGYEGGQHCVGRLGAENNTDLTAKFVSMNGDARMGTLYQSYLSGLKSRGLALLCHFVNTAIWEKWGYFGARQYYDETIADQPKFAALMRFLGTQRGSLSMR